MKIQSQRQGDVLLLRVEVFPIGVSEITQDGPIVLAFGEMTGHQHAIYNVLDDVTKTPKAKVMWDASAERFLQVLAQVALKHEEHTKHDVAPGIYYLPIQFEYTPAELRPVAD